MNEMVKENPYRGEIMEFHILQSFPVSCLNRDDVGSPKSALVGGVPRARVSSQCWKRQVRLEMHALGTKLATRTVLLKKKIMEALTAAGATEEQAENCALVIANLYLEPKKKGKKEKDEEKDDKDKKKKDKENTLVFISDAEVEAFVKLSKSLSFQIDTEHVSKLAKEVKLCTAYDGVDIALFGRMVAANPSLNVEAAASFSHAISTHKATSELDFFTALDDLGESSGAAHMNTSEYNAATYYRYISLSLGQLYATLHGEGMEEAIDKFVKALYLAIPAARQHSESSASYWDFARIYVRKGQRLQVPFETPVKRALEGGYLEESKKAMLAYLDKKEKLSGSLFGLVKKIDFGDNEDLSIDDVIDQLKAIVRN